MEKNLSWLRIVHPYRWHLAGIVVVVLVASVTLLPLFYLVLESLGYSLRTPQLSLDAFHKAFTNPSIPKTLLNTFILIFIRLIPAVVGGFLISYCLVRTDLMFKNTIEFLLWIAFFLPTVPLALGWVLLMDPYYGILNKIVPLFDIYSYTGIAWVHFSHTSLPIMVILMVPAVKLFNSELEEAALVCGSNRFHAMRRVVLPLFAPVLIAASILSIIRGMESFEVELLLGTPVGISIYSTKIYEYLSFEPVRIAEASALSVLVIGFLFIFALAYQSRILKNRYTTVSGRGVSFKPLSLGRWRKPISYGLLGYCIFSIFPPMLLLLTGSFMKVYGFFEIESPFTTSHWRVVLSDSSFLPSLKNTLIIGLSTALLGVACYTLIAYIIVRSKVRFKGAIGFLTWIPWGMPGLLLGMSLMRTFLGIPSLNLFYGTTLALIFARVIASMPLGSQMITSSFLQLHEELEEASAISGASWGYTFWRIILPLLKPMLLSVGILTLVSAVRDISSMALLSTSNTRPLSILLLEYSVGGELERGAVVGIVVTVLVVLVAVLARKLGFQGQAEQL